jgi:aminoglycoside phosphotransferase family enzyme/predicted kinase
MSKMPSQDAVFDFLANPATHGGQAVKRITTHAAVVFLAGERALKIKRAVRFPFLDYSTLERRKQACAAEIDVNRMYAPQLYRRVVPITREADGKLAVDGRGEAIEWAVEMVRFDENRTLDHIAEESGIDLDLADKLAREVAAAHARAPAVDPVPWLASLPTFLSEHVTAFAQDPNLFPPAKVEALDQSCRQAFTAVRPLLVSRGQQGLVRRCHGDLHLGNVVLLDRHPVLFDAIEFDPLIASTDVLYDLAFLLMDLVERNLTEAANMVLNRYLMETRREVDLDGLAALPLFLSLRAAIRAKVTAARLSDGEQPNSEEIKRSAGDYFVAALRLIRPLAPRMVAVGGLSGTGKTMLARALAPTLSPAPGAVLLRSDVERKVLHGVGETERLQPEAYSRESNAKVYQTLAVKARRILTARHSAVVDAVFAHSDEREAMAAAARDCGVSFRGLFLTADLGTRIERIGARARDASDATAEIARLQEQYELGPLTWRVVDASGTPQDTLARAQVLLAT